MTWAGRDLRYNGADLLDAVLSTYYLIMSTMGSRSGFSIMPQSQVAEAVAYHENMIQM